MGKKKKGIARKFLDILKVVLKEVYGFIKFLLWIPIIFLKKSISLLKKAKRPSFKKF